jgi:hypothetical protein
MSEDMVKAIGHECIMGQSLLWRSLASFDHYNETMEISPAYVSSGCADFRISIPCTMTTDRSPTPIAFFIGDREQPFMNGFLPPPPVGVATATSSSNESTKREYSTPTQAQTPSVGFASVAMRAIQAASQALLDLLPASRTSHIGTSSIRPTRSSNFMSPHNRPPKANPLNHNVTVSPPTDSSLPNTAPHGERHQIKPSTASTRPQVSRADIHAKWRHARHLVDPTPKSLALYKLALLNGTEPNELSYPVDELKRTGRLGTNGELELGDGASAAVARALDQEAIKRHAMQTEFGERTRKLETEIMALKRALAQAHSTITKIPSPPAGGILSPQQPERESDRTFKQWRPTNTPKAHSSSTRQDHPTQAKQQGGPAAIAPCLGANNSYHDQSWNRIKRERLLLESSRPPGTENSQAGSRRNQHGVSWRSSVSASSSASVAVIAALARLPEFKSTS